MALTSFWKIFRLLFVLFCLYLMGDVFSRWDGVQYYAPFHEFLPSISLVYIFWSLTALLVAFGLWLVFSLIRWVFCRFHKDISTEHFILNTCIFIMLCVLVWKAKRVMLPYLETTIYIKLIIFFLVAILSAFLPRPLSTKMTGWITGLQERITPLVWIFGIFVVVSLPIVAYHSLSEHAEDQQPNITSTGAAADIKRPNIILVTFDTLTTRNMSLHEYERDTTPFIKQWGSNSTVFERVKAADNFTTPTMASLATGKRLWSHQVYHLAGSKPLRSRTENMPMVLKNNGYYNMAFIVNPHSTVKTMGIEGSFDIVPSAVDFHNATSFFGYFDSKYASLDIFLYRLFGDKIRIHDWIIRYDFILFKVLERLKLYNNFSKTTVPPEKVFKRFLNILDNKPQKPYFAWLHVFPPHDPYLPPEPFMGLFNDSPKHRSFFEQANGGDIARARYDEFIRYCDSQFENFIKHLTENDELENTIIILSSDHGESFEHNYFQHSKKFLYEQVTSIPLIIKEPGQTEGKVVSTLTEQVDIPATILELAGIPVPAWMDGRSLVPLLQGKDLPPRPVFAMDFKKNFSRGHQITKGTIAIWDTDYKLIHYLEEDESLLFNLKNDPGELENLFDKEHVVGKRLLNIIHENLEKANEKIRNE